MPVLDRDVSAEEGRIGEDALVPDDRVVADVNADHHVIAVADRRVAVGVERSVDRGMLAKHVALSDTHAADMRRAGDMLRSAADHHVLVELVVRSSSDAGLDHRPRSDGAVLSEDDPALDHRERTDSDPRAENGVRTDDCQRVDAHGRPPRMVKGGHEPPNRASRGSAWIPTSSAPEGLSSAVRR